MKPWIAFLRGINVGGNNLLKMDYLCKLLRNAGFTDVDYVLQSGNFYFETSVLSPQQIEEKIESILLKETGKSISAFVRPFEEIIRVIQENPFTAPEEGREQKYYVCFLKQPVTDIRVSEKYVKEGLMFAGADEKEIFLTAGKEGGRFTFPNTWMEKELKQDSTARNIRTLEKIVKKFAK